MRKVIRILISLLIAALMTAPAFAKNADYVHDDAGVLTDDQIVKLNAYAEERSDEMDMDIHVVTSISKNGKSLMEYADDYWVNHGYGRGEDKDGVLILLDFEERTMYISTSGKAIEYFNDIRIENIVGDEDGYGGDDELWDALIDGDYEEGFLISIDDLKSYYDEGLPQPKVNRINLFELIISLGVAAFVGFSRVRSIKNEYLMKKEKNVAANMALSYRAVSGFAYATTLDNMIDRQVSRRIIPVVQVQTGGGSGRTSGGSSWHTSSGGHTHGGGGGGRHF